MKQFHKAILSIYVKALGFSVSLGKNAGYNSLSWFGDPLMVIISLKNTHKKKYSYRTTQKNLEKETYVIVCHAMPGKL